MIETVRRILAEQSPGYFIYPNAAAFAAEGLDPQGVAYVLKKLHESGEIEREQIVVDKKTIGGGYRLNAISTL